MKIINIRMLQVKVSSYSALDNSVSLEIDFDDGRVKQIYRTTTLEEPEKEADDIINELIKMERNINLEFTGRALSGEVHVVFQDLELVKPRITSFIRAIISGVEKARIEKDPHNYLDLMSDVLRARLLLVE